MSYDLVQYVPLGILLAIATAFGLTNLILPTIVGKLRVVTPVKDTPYECGLPPEQEQRTGFSVKFYLVAMLFIVFDLEVVFIVSWATAFQDLVNPNGDGVGVTALWAMVLFIFILEVGHFYIWKQGALTWAPRNSDAVEKLRAGNVRLDSAGNSPVTVGKRQPA
jgi:NADH-quinone oxidoreductase subunit A